MTCVAKLPDTITEATIHQELGSDLLMTALNHEHPKGFEEVLIILQLKRRMGMRQSGKSTKIAKSSMNTSFAEENHHQCVLLGVCVIHLAWEKDRE